jgi:hypothetical protein
VHSQFPKVLALVLLTVSMAGAQGAAPKPQPKTPPRASEQTLAASEPFSVAIVERLLNNLRNAFEGEDRTQTLALFDREQMPDYSEFADNIGLFFQLYEPIRVQYRVVQTVDEAEKRVAIVEFTVEGTLASDTQPPARRTEQLRFKFGFSRHSEQPGTSSRTKYLRGMPGNNVPEESYS